ncbi:hypothetical protein J4417_01910 [Candidatus Woesearchaeota archaeon]|nr:hypothetical protein [Candidatus Woesearchaeota archaeon]
MEKKRLVLVIVSILLSILLYLPLNNAEINPEKSFGMCIWVAFNVGYELGGENFFCLGYTAEVKQLNFMYAIGRGFRGIDFYDPTSSGLLGYNIFQNFKDGNLLLADVSSGLMGAPMDNGCVWKVPRSTAGCYYLSSTLDPDLNYDVGCAASLIQPGTIITTNKEMKKDLDGAVFDTVPSEYLIKGNYNKLSAPIFPEEIAFPKSYGCFNTDGLNMYTPDNEYAWIVCDASSLEKFVVAEDGANAYFCKQTSQVSYQWVSSPLICKDVESEGGNCDSNMAACVNSYGEKETKDDGTIISSTAWNDQAGCCGDDGLEDLGSISKDKKYLCMNEQITSDIVTYGGETGKSISDVYKDVKENYKGSWKWISASEGSFIIKTKVDTNQDFLSNGMHWYTCNDTNAGLLKKEGIESAGDIGKAGRFFCLGNGAFGFWKECITEEEQKPINDYSRQILLGENLLTLYPKDIQSISAEGQIPLSSVPTEYERKAIPEYSQILKLIFSFTEDPYFKLATENLDPKVIFSGLSPDNKPIEDNLFNDYLSVPYLEKDVPLTADIYYPVNEPTIISVIPAQIKKIYIGGSNNNLFCSGKEEFEEGKSSWIADLDDSPKLPDDKTACEANGYTWTGNECCGDDMYSGLDDFYADDGFVTGLDEEGNQILDSEKPRGCWAGISLKEGEAVGQIKFTISAGGKSLEETYPCKKDAGKECRYFIKGIINDANKIIEKVKLSNLYPEKYDLTARLYNKAANQGLPFEIKITAEKVEVDRNKYYLEAKNVPAIAIVGKDENGNGKFFTCGANLAGMSAGMEEKVKEMPLCSISGDNYCSANGWTNKAPAKFNFNPETKEYEPTEDVYEPAVFDHSGSIVFGRNLIPNAQLEIADKKIKDWEQGPLVSILTLGNNILTITGTDPIKSPFFYLENKLYSLSFNSDCKVDNTLFVSAINKKGEKITLSSPQQTGNNYLFSFTPLAGEYQVEFSPLGMCSLANLSLYLLPPAFNEISFNYDALHQPLTAQQCCPENSCWNGFTCVGDMSSQTEREEIVTEGVSYRCLKGNWTAQEKKWDWANKIQGYCEKETQCFVAPITPLSPEMQGATAGVSAGEFYKGTTPSCINDTESIFDHYCQNGEWTTRTKFVITSLQDLAKNNNYKKYTLYCGPYRETLNEYGSAVYDVEQFIGGEQDYTKTSADKGCQFKKDDSTCQTTGKLCFSGANKNLIPDEENTCVNNFCLLTHEEDKEQKTIFAVSLNQPIDDASNSFLRSLGIEIPEEIQSYCPTEGEGWVDCKETVGFLKYHPKLNLVAYSSEKFAFEPSTLTKIWTGVKDAVGGAIDFVGGLVGIKIEKMEPGQLPEPLAEKTVTSAFTICPGMDTSRYFSFFGEGKSAMACVWNNTLSASYYNFVTPICDYVSHTPKEKQWWLAEEAHEGKELPLQGELSVICDEKNKNLLISDPNDINFWWPQLTGRLRIN